uniref:Uncharacterized protein n=1 Tax=Zooxanthella nutricula TaxID=1333877 RepID=A0A6U6GEN3_9DINO
MGSSCSVSMSSDLHNAAKEIKQQLATLEANIVQSDIEIREHVARVSVDALSHQRALNAMKKKRLFEEQRKQLIGAQFNIDSLVYQRDQARVALNAVKALEVGTQALKADQERMDPGKVEDLCDEAAVLADEMRVISDSLAASYSIGDDNAEAAEALDREYMKFDQHLAQVSAAVGSDKISAGAGKHGALSAASLAAAGKSPATPATMRAAAAVASRRLVGEH